jgi:hypothetical protein
MKIAQMVGQVRHLDYFVEEKKINGNKYWPKVLHHLVGVDSI